MALSKLSMSVYKYSCLSTCQYGCRYTFCRRYIAWESTWLALHYFYCCKTESKFITVPQTHAACLQHSIHALLYCYITAYLLKPKFHLLSHVTTCYDTTSMSHASLDVTCHVMCAAPCLFQHGRQWRSSSARNVKQYHVLSLFIISAHKLN